MRHLPLIAASITCSGLLACSSTFAKTPTGDYAGFAQCPRYTPSVELCLLTHVNSGEVKIGKLAVPISRELLLQGGIVFHEVVPIETFVGAVNGQTLTRTPLPVPGGLASIVNPGSLPASLQRPYAQAVGTGSTTVTATTELVGIPLINTGNLESKQGTGLVLPVKIKLENPFLGHECYLGSTGSPVTFNLTTGETNPPKPNSPIQGKLGHITAEDGFNLVEINGGWLVDNTFPIPPATGCGGALASILDPSIDAKLGLPSPAGTNTAILDDTIQEGTTLSVIGSEK